MKPLTPAQIERRRRKVARLEGIASSRAINRDQNARDKEAADLRRRARANGVIAMAQAFASVKAAKA